MDSQRNDILSYYQPIIKSIKSFRGADAYIIDTIEKVSALSPKMSVDMKMTSLYDVIKLLTMIRTNKL